MFLRMILITIFVTSSSAAFAEPEVPRVAFSGRELDPKLIYYVTYNCTATGNLDEFLPRQGRWPKTYTAATHSFALTTAANVNLDENSFANGTLLPKLLFTVGRSGGASTNIDQRDANCGGALIVKGTDRPKIAYHLKFSRNNVSPTFLRTIVFLADVIQPIYTIATGTALPLDTAADIGRVKDVVTKYQAYLALFTDPNSTSKLISLRTGKTTIRTSVSKITFDVIPVDSFFALGENPVQGQFRSTGQFNSYL